MSACHAHRLGVSRETYDRRRLEGLKWCWFHALWHQRGAFNRDARRGDGLFAVCRVAQSERYAAQRARRRRVRS